MVIEPRVQRPARAQRRTRVGVLAYPGCFAAEVFGITDVLTIGARVAEASTPGSGDALEVSVVSTRPAGRVRVSGGVEVGCRPPGRLDVVVVPGFDLSAASAHGVQQALAGLAPERDFLRDAHTRGTQVVSVCVGAFLLADAGLLAERRATTSWLFADELATRAPTTTVCADELVVRDRGVTTTAAFTVMYDVTLDLLRSLYGSEVARSTARIALLDDGRRSQSPYVDERLLARGEPTFGASVQRWLLRHLDEPFDLARLAAEFGVSTRTLSRRFAADTGTTPLAHLQRVRTQRAKHLLEATDLMVPEVAARVGYGDAATFAGLFRRHVGMPPGAYRTSFRTSSRSAAGQ